MSDTTRPATDSHVTTRVIQDEAEWNAIRRKWDELYAEAPSASTPLDHAWLRTWWRVYQSSFRAASLRVITVWRGTRLIGALPLYIHRDKGVVGTRHLRIVSTGEEEFEETCPDYLNVLSRPGEEAQCARSAWRAIDDIDWDHLELLNLAEHAPLLVADAVPSNACQLRIGACPVADLTDGFEAYLQKLSPNGRQQARRLLREGESAGARLEIAEPARLADAFGDLMRLHQDRWQRDGKAGVFAAQRFVEFHRQLVAEWLPAGRAVLARLSLPSGPVAVLYGFLTGAKFDFYQSGVQLDTNGTLRSPGRLAHLLLMRALAERRVTAYDFLRGASPYKTRLATRENRLCGIEIWRPTLRAAAHLSARRASQTVRRVCRDVRDRDWFGHLRQKSGDTIL